jgi:hypothetical protein
MMRKSMDAKTELEGLLAFLRDYISADHETEVARYTERDQKEYLTRIRHLEQFFVNVSTGLSASLPEFDDEERAIFTAKAARLVPRSLFKVKKWQHPREGVLYQAYLGSPTPAKQKGYLTSVLVKKVRGDFKIVGRYAVCLACFATGRHGGKRCPDCSAPGWDYREGLKLKTFGKLQETLRLEAPTNPAFLSEYESD